MIAFLRRNWVYKLLSLLLSILLYFIASNQRNPIRTSTVTIQPEVVALPTTLAISAQPRLAQITLSGPQTELELVRQKGVQVTVNANGARSGKNFLPVTYILPKEVQGRVAVDAPPTMEVELEARTARAVPVRVLFVNQPPSGMSYGEPVALPERVTVNGLASEVERVERVVALLDNSDGRPVERREVPVVAQDARQQVLSRVSLEPERVRVSLPISTGLGSKLVVLSAHLNGALPPGYRLKDYQFVPASVLVRGETGLLGPLSSLTLPVALSGLTRTETRLVSVPLPPGVSLATRLPIRLTLTVEGAQPLPKSPRTARTFSRGTGNL